MLAEEQAMVSEEKFVAVDNSKAKIVAYIVVAAFLALILVFGLRSSAQAPLHEGDKRESITCQWCEGAGTTEGERCRYCLGAKKLKAIIPGPNHPVRVRGTIWNLSAFPNREAAELQAESVDYNKVLLKPLPETVNRATLRFEGADGENTEIQGKVSGRFRGFLKPGDYKLKIEREGFSPYEQAVSIPVRQHPVWPDIPGVEIEDKDQVTMNVFLQP